MFNFSGVWLHLMVSVPTAALVITYIHLSKQRKRLHRYRDAEGHYRAIIKDSDVSIPITRLAEAIIKQADPMVKQGRHEEALANYDVALSHYHALNAGSGVAPLRISLAKTLNNRACLLINLNRHEEALASSDKALDALNADSDATPLHNYLAMTLNNRANALSGLSRHEEALASYDEALGHYHALNADNGVAPLRDNLANTLNDRANALAWLRRHEEALTSYDEALRHYYALRADSDASPLRAKLASTLNDRASALAWLRRYEEALINCTKALDHYHALNADSNEAPLRAGLAKTLNNRAIILSRLNRHEEALTSCDKALDALNADSNASPLRADLAKILDTRANALFGLSRHEEALARCDEALDHYHALNADSDTLPLRADLAKTLNNRSYALSILSRHEEALTSCDEALMHYYALNADSNASPLRAGLATTLRNRADLLYRLGRHKEALTRCDEALGYYHALNADSDTSSLRADLAITLNNRANVLSRLSRDEEALTSYDEALGHYHALNADSDASPLRESLAQVLFNRAHLLSRLNRHKEALTSYDEAVGHYRRALISDSNTAPLRVALAETLSNRANALSILSRHEEALTSCDEALGHYHDLKADSDASPLRTNLAETLINRSFALCILNRSEEALTSCDEALRHYYALRADSDASPLRVELTKTLSDRAYLLVLMNRDEEALISYYEMLDKLEHSASLIANLPHFLATRSKDFIKIIPGVQQRATLNRQAKLMKDWLGLCDLAKLRAEQENIDYFWQSWLQAAMLQLNFCMILDILAHTHGRRMLDIALTELYQSQVTATLSEHESRYLQCLTELRQLELDLLGNRLKVLDSKIPIRTQGSLETDCEDEILRRKWEQIHQELQTIRYELIAQGRLPDLQVLSQFNMKDMQAKLSIGQVLLVGVVPQAYGIVDQPPLLLAIWHKDIGMNNEEARIEALEIKQAVAACEAFTDLDVHAAQSGSREGMRDAGNDAVPIEKPVRNISQAREILFKEMKTVWDNVLAELERLHPECREIHLVSHGILHSLPWQGTCPDAKFNVHVYPGLYSYWQNSQHAPTSQPLRPSPELKLRVVAIDAADDPLKRLYFVEAERLIINKIWGNEVVEVATDFESSVGGDTIPTIMLLSGHGSIKNGFVLKADPDAPKYLSQSELLRSRHALQGLIASACLLGRCTDQSHEPLGLLAAARARKSLRFACGALLPVGDFGACVLSLLFNYQWQAGSAPDQAMATALKQLETGDWPEGAIKVFKQVFTEYLPVLADAIRSDQEKMSLTVDDEQFKQRKNNILWFLHCNDPKSNRHLMALMKGEHQAAQDLINSFCEPRHLKMLGNSLKLNFIPFWTWG